MAEIRHYIDGQDFGEPRNWREIEITLDWLNKKESGTINVSDLAFADEANKYLQKRILDGLEGGVGVFEGDPYKIVIGDQQDPTFIFEGYLDFTEGANRILGKEEIILSLKKEKGEDWLNDVADGFSLAYLYEQGVIKKSDFVKVPYVINFIPDGMQLVILSMSIYMMTKEIIENVEKVSETIAELTDAGTPVVGVSVGVGAGVVTAWDLGNFLLVTLKTIARIAFAIAMTVAVVNLINEVFKQILPAKRYHLGMTFNKMMELCCKHLGMEFKSNLLQIELKDWTHIPMKSKKGGTDGERGFPTNSESIYTFGGLIRELKKTLNADYRIRDNVFYFERRDQFKFPSNYVMPSFFNNQERILDEFKLNADEIISNYNIYWAYDTQDQNTLENQTGRVFQAITSPNIVKNKQFVTIKGLAEIDIPFSIGVEKRKLTAVEEVAKILGAIVDGLTGIFGGGTNFKNKIENRIGSLMLSSDMTTTGKVVVMNGSKLANDQRKLLDARKLWDNYHFINSFAKYQGNHNQYLRFEKQPVSMTIKDLAELMNNNIAVDANGQEYEVEFVVYTPETDTALIDYRVKKEYTTNLKIEFL